MIFFMKGIDMIDKSSLLSSDDPKTISEIALQVNAIPSIFPPAALAEAKRARPVELGAREDLRAIPLVTIDSEEAHDFDDAVFAEPSKEGFHMIVAIADVAHYVKAGSALDDEAQARGNSTYLPDRVVPMLPEELSNGLCSLKPNEDRACLAAHIWISAKGEILRGGFSRALMRSAARLTYNQVQRTLDGAPHDATKAVIAPLHAAYRCLATARARRGALDLNVPKRQIVLKDNGTVKTIERRNETEAHKIIEEFMIAANVLAARTLRGSGLCLYRVHDAPSVGNIEKLAAFVRTLGIVVPKEPTQVIEELPFLLALIEDTPLFEPTLLMLGLSLDRAAYSPINRGHFGLALPEYTHITSPIRRYADLIVHRALIRRLGLGVDGLADAACAALDRLAAHLSETEYASKKAEREAMNAYAALFFARREGQVFPAKICRVIPEGLFVRTLDEATMGFVPNEVLPYDRYFFLQNRQALIGRRWKRLYQIGRRVDVRLQDVDPKRKTLIFSLEDKRPLRPRLNATAPENSLQKH
jgi:ribonuclease R